MHKFNTVAMESFMSLYDGKIKYDFKQKNMFGLILKSRDFAIDNEHFTAHPLPLVPLNLYAIFNMHLSI